MGRLTSHEYYPKNHGISSHWWGLKIPDPCQKDIQTPVSRGSQLILRVAQKLCKVGLKMAGRSDAIRDNQMGW